MHDLNISSMPEISHTKGHGLSPTPSPTWSWACLTFLWRDGYTVVVLINFITRTVCLFLCIASRAPTLLIYFSIQYLFSIYLQSPKQYIKKWNHLVLPLVLNSPQYSLRIETFGYSSEWLSRVLSLSHPPKRALCWLGRAAINLSSSTTKRACFYVCTSLLLLV